MTELAIREEALFIMRTLQEAGFDAYLVGGAVRDLLRAGGEALPNDADYDFTTNAKPEEIKALFPESFYENQFGTVSVTHQELLAQMGMELETTSLSEQRETFIDLDSATKIHDSLIVPEDQETTTTQWLPNFEITTYRSKEVYADHRRPDPDQLQWGTTIEEDLERRDFTINAMAIGVDFSTDDYELIDPYQGQAHLAQQLIVTVGDPATRFQEDALRLLRAVRFSVQLNMQIEDKTFEAILAHSDLLQHISLERIGDEFMKIMKSDYPAEGVKLLDETNLLRFILPELLDAKGVEQAGHHTTDVWTHSLDALKESPSTDPIVRLATLLHDIGKPVTFERTDNDSITFYNHEVVGARMASAIAKRLRLSKHDTQRIFLLVRHHMFYYQPHHTDSAVRRFMRRVGLDNIDDILDLREADRLGSGARKTSWRLEEMKQRMMEQLHQPMDVTDLAIDGHDLMEQLGMKPGPEIGKILQQLLEEVLENPELNSTELLLEKARAISS